LPNLSIITFPNSAGGNLQKGNEEYVYSTVDVDAKELV